MVERTFTNCFLIKINVEGKPIEICLGLKKRKFGVGLWNGAGGKPELDGTIEMAAKREVEEEFDVIPKEIVKVGEFDFSILEQQIHATMHAFLVTKWIGEPKETDEMNPRWFKLDEIPYDQMWQSDREFLPVILGGSKVRGRYTFEKEGGRVLGKQLDVVEFL